MRVSFALVLIWSLSAVGAGLAHAQSGTFSVLTPAQSGVDVTIMGNSADFGFGAALEDFDGDGWLDLFVNTEAGAPPRVFRNLGGTFTDISAASGFTLANNGRGVKIADYDNDGDLDIFVAKVNGSASAGSPNRLWRNNGDNTFTNVAEEAGLAAPMLSYGAAWADYNNDGWLDLYVANRREPNQLFRANGDGTFTDVAPALGLDHDRATLEAVWFDYDNDGDQDLYASTDKLGGNKLWRNEGDGTFTDVSLASHTNASINSMGVAVGDYNNDGWLDMYITNTSEGNVFYHNNGDGTFTDVAVFKGMAVNRYGWGTDFFDYDNDGDLDLYVVNWWGFLPDIRAENVFFRNNGNGSFTNVTSQLGVGNADKGFGLAIGDYNNDGFLDMYITNNGQPSVFCKNNPGTNNWLKVRTQGVQSNRDGIGARVRVAAGGLEMIREVCSSTSYLSHNSLEVEFGVGNANSIDLLEIKWPSGIVDQFHNVDVDQRLVIVEGSSALPTVASLTAVPSTDGVALDWSVSQGSGFSGFRVYRTLGDNEPVTLNQTLLDPSARSYLDASAEPSRRYQYRVAVVLDDDTELQSAPVSAQTVPASLALQQNYPNPFNPTTTIEFTLPWNALARVYVYDSSGRLVRTLASQTLPAGINRLEWDGTNDDGQAVASGVYHYLLRAAGFELRRKMVLVK